MTRDPLSVVLVGNFALDRQESMLRFGSMLVDGLRARGHSVASLAPRPIFTRFLRNYRYAGAPKYLGYLDKYIAFPRTLRRHHRRNPHAVVHIVDHANARYGVIVNSLGGPTLTTCHDLLQIRAAHGEFPEQAVGRMGRRFQYWIQTNLARLPSIACVSQKTASDLQRLTDAASDRLCVISNGLNFPYRPLAYPEAWGRLEHLWQSGNTGLSSLARAKGGFILHVGGSQWYKNRPGLLRIFANVRARLSPAPRLLIVGPALSPADRALADELGIIDHTMTVTGVSNLLLEGFYSTAEALLLPSLEEGFGWPIAEAQACGCPVITSNRAPMTEVGGSSAIYLDPVAPDSAANVIVDAWPTRFEKARMGLTGAKRWEPQRMILLYEAAYRRLRSANEQAHLSEDFV